MTTALTAIVEAVSTSLSDQSLCWVESWDEVGMAPVSRIIEQGPLQHGDSDIDFRLRARIFALGLGMVGQGATDALALADLYSRRRTLLNIFKPRLNPVKLLWTFDDGSLRQIDCHFYDKMPLGTPDRSGLYQYVPVALRAPNPLFYDPTQQIFEFGLSGGGGSGAIPLAIPMAVGASVLNQTIAVPYGGDFLENPIVAIQGPITSCVITNAATGEVLDFTGYTIAAGASVTVDCRYGYKTVLDNSGGNQISKLTDASDLATFHLAANPDAAGGVNSITVTGTSVTTATEVYLSYYNRYVGI